MTLAPASQFRWANLLTYLSVCAAAVGAAFTTGPDTRFWAGAALAFGIACDLFDGRFARLFPRTEDDARVGVEIDSLADVVAFGFAPPVYMFRAVAPSTPIEVTMVVGAGLFYVLSIMTRLAHFNVFQAGTGGFIGLPSNMPPLIFAVLLLWVPAPAVASAALILGGAAAVAGFHIPRPTPVVLYGLLAIALVVAGVHISRLLVG
jgi:phosphatidylserine synthase